MPPKLFIYHKDLMTIEKVSRNTAYQRFNELIFLLNKPPKGKVTLHEYCQFNGLQLQDIAKILT